MKITVIICTHNPRQAYLARTLGSLRVQTLPFSEWELVLIDNASNVPLNLDLSWHPSARLVFEKELGLTPARCRGIAEARGHLLVFVDDDVVLCKSYLAKALAIAEKYEFLGAWGAGIIAPEFETVPPRWTTPYLTYLAIRDFRQLR